MSITADELLKWAFENVRGKRNWLMLMNIKTREKDIKSITKEGIAAIELFVELVKQERFYSGFGEPGSVHVGDMNEALALIKKTVKEE